MVANILRMDISTSGKMNLVNILGMIGKESCNSDATMTILMVCLTFYHAIGLLHKFVRIR